MSFLHNPYYFDSQLFEYLFMVSVVILNSQLPVLNIYSPKI